MPLQYKIDVLSALKEKGYNTNQLRKGKILAEGVIQSLREKKPISWANLEKLCAFLQVQPGDILEYVVDDNSAQGIVLTEQEQRLAKRLQKKLSDQ